MLLQSNCPRQPQRSRGPAREGPALLQGLIICGLCGRFMTINYQRPSRGLVPIYTCDAEHIERGRPVYQRTNGEAIDAAVGNLLVEIVTPAAVAAAVEVQRELQVREDVANRLRRQSVDRARYETDLAHRRYLLVDPENRLVASTLEKVWNEKLQALSRVEADCEAAGASAKSEMTREQQTALQALPKGFAALWRDPRTPYREKKRMARLIIEDVTLVGSPSLPIMSVHVRLKGGVTRTLSVPRPLNQKERMTPIEIVRQIQELAPSHGDAQTAQVLNQRGLLTSTRRRFTLSAVRWIRAAHGIPGRSGGRSRPRGRSGAFIATPVAPGWPGVV
ncbi:MAG TPA: recombinase zinc beta ribbon domain-containing protein [Thermoplasmata archaeon]|nr:recombinase zinc beta ribbon domain-containing protein [Thermoplasmata archaeon]